MNHATHPCYKNPNPRSRLMPDITFTLKYMKMCANTIPQNYPYELPAIEGFVKLHVPFFEFRGHGAPPVDIGTPGDVYIDLTPSAYALYCKCEEDWAKWAGPAAALSEVLAHPHFADCREARFVNFHPEEGTEWVCARTISRRRLALREAGVLKDSDGARESLDLASTIIQGYLAGTPVKRPSSPPPSVRSARSTTSRGHKDSKASEAFYPSKRARTLASSSSVSVALAANRAKSKAPPPPSPPYAFRHPSPDPATTQLEKELKALQADKELHSLRRRKRDLMASLPTVHGFTLSPELLQKVEKEYNKFHPSAVPSVTPAEAKLALPELRCRVDQAKKALLATKMKRTEAEKQLAERRQWCDAIRQKS
ncbi:hypothetical protein MVEN_02412000 [Mycena venus]|uniref:Uncharacterized protein n=1 Tax=Mycena venus TaxID=2733690 RepID=A0A8H7CCZ6_9AGAR|nr:hypothetical protein MVEN_02412000 [Mycena venus]